MSSDRKGNGIRATADLSADKMAVGPPNPALIAARLRTNALREHRDPDSRLWWYSLEHAIAGDLGHVHVAHDLRSLPLTASQGLRRPLVLWSKRIAQRLIRALPEAQSVWNGAAARLFSFLLRQIETHERAIETLERQVAELERRLPPDVPADDNRRL
jgi:hypothetical protein